MNEIAKAENLNCSPSRPAWIERKEKAVFKDWDTAFAGYARLTQQVSEIRRWTVTLMVAALGLLASGRADSPELVLLSAASALFAFSVLELRERSSMRFNKEEVLAVETISMIQDEIEYEAALGSYEFRDLRLARLSRIAKLKHLIRSVWSPNVIFWYSFWSALLALVHGLR